MGPQLETHGPLTGTMQQPVIRAPIYKSVGRVKGNQEVESGTQGW